MTGDEYKSFDIASYKHQRLSTRSQKALFFTWLGGLGFGIAGVTGVFRGLEFFDLPPAVSITIMVACIGIGFPMIYYIGWKGNDPRLVIDKIKDIFRPRVSKPVTKKEEKKLPTPAPSSPPPAAEGEKTRYKPKFAIY